VIALKAYIEIHTEPGSDTERIVTSIRNSEGVKEACRVIGRADILVSVEGRDLRHISDIVTQKICAIRGIASGETLMCVDSGNMPQQITPSNGQEQIPAITFS
jgi:DNA-binding Lrp family transcriptional regulator